MISFVTVTGVAVTLIASGVVENQLSKKGKEGQAATLRAMTHLGAGLYASYFLMVLMKIVSSAFL